MEELKVKLTGACPLLMHDNKAANPLNAYAKALKALTSKRKKSDDDHREIARLEWESGLYLHEGIVAIPAKCTDKCFWEGAKRNKNGKLYRSGVMVAEDFHPLNYKGAKISVKESREIPNPDLDKFFEDHAHTSIVKVGNQQVVRTRPIFHDWSLECTLYVDTGVINLSTVLDIAKDSGSYVGLLEQRPRLGRFNVVKL